MPVIQPNMSPDTPSSDLGTTPGTPLENTPGGPQPVTEATIETEKVEPPLPPFDARYREPFEGLLYLGRREKTFHWMGHQFVIRTINTDTNLEIGMLTKQYEDTSQGGRAWQTAMVAACLVSVDGRPPYVPLSPNENPLQGAFQWAKEQYPWTIDAIFEKFVDLEAEVSQVLEAMGKA